MYESYGKHECWSDVFNLRSAFQEAFHTFVFHAAVKANPAADQKGKSGAMCKLIHLQTRSFLNF